MQNESGAPPQDANAKKSSAMDDGIKKAVGLLADAMKAIDLEKKDQEKPADAGDSEAIRALRDALSLLQPHAASQAGAEVEHPPPASSREDPAKKQRTQSPTR